MGKGVEVQTIVLFPVTGGTDENKAFWQATPSGEIKLGTVNAAAQSPRLSLTASITLNSRKPTSLYDRPLPAQLQLDFRHLLGFPFVRGGAQRVAYDKGK